MLRRSISSLILLLLLGSILWPTSYNAIYRSGALMALDRQAEAHVDTALRRALTTFALARATNAVISVLQGTEIQLAPAGLGVNLTPGEVLDPVNDLIERFSWVMLVSSTALGLQKFLIKFGEWVSIKLVLVPALLCFGVALWRRGPGRLFWYSLATRLLLLALVLRLSAPFLSVINHGAYSMFLDDQFNAATQGLKQGQAALEQAQPDLLTDTAPPGNEGFLDKLKRSGHQMAQAVDVRSKLQWLEKKASELIRHILQLVVIFSLNTIMLPLLFIWLIWCLMAGLFRTDTKAWIQNQWQRRIATGNP